MSEKKTRLVQEESIVSWGSTVLFMFFVFFLFNFWQLVHEKYFVENIIGESGAVIGVDYNIGIILIVLAVLAAVLIVLSLIFRKKIWQFVTSMQLGISLMSGLTIGTIIGTLVFQNAQAQDYISFYSEPMYDIFTRLHFVDVFDAWWFLAYELILAIVLVCVTLKRRFWLPEKLGAATVHFGIVTVIIGAFIGVAYHEEATLFIGEGEETEYAVRNDFLDKFRDIPGYMAKLEGRNDIRDPYDLIKTENMSMIPKEFLVPLGGKFKLNNFEELYYDEPYVVGQSQWTTRKDIRSGEEQQVTRSAVQVAFDSKKPVVLKEGFGRLSVLKTYKNYLLKENLVEKEGGKSFARIKVGNFSSGLGEILVNEDSQGTPLKGSGDGLEAMANGVSSLSGSAFTFRYSYQEPDAEALAAMAITKASPKYLISAKAMTQGGGNSAEVSLMPGETGKMGDTGYSVKMLRFLPDAANPDSQLMNDPAAEIEVSGGEITKPIKIVIPASGEVMATESIMELVRTTKMLFKFASMPQSDLLLIGSTGELHVYSNGELKEKVNLQESEYTPMYTGITLKLDKVYKSAQIEKIHSDENPETNIAVEIQIEKDGKKTTAVLRLLDNNVTREMTEQDHESYFLTLDARNFLSFYIRGDYIKDWRSHSSVLSPQGQTIDHVIRVNEPLVYNGFYYYQTDWRPKVPYGETPEKWYSILRVTRDPGLLLVYIGIALMTFGMIWAFYVGPRFKKKENS